MTSSQLSYTVKTGNLTHFLSKTHSKKQCTVQKNCTKYDVNQLFSYTHNWFERGVHMAERWGVPPMGCVLVKFYIWFQRPECLISNVWMPYSFLKPQT